MSLPAKATEYIKYLNSDQIISDETDDHNIRYIGANPNNYVLFNNELWRIIGVMNDVEDANGVVEPRIKLIRSDNIGMYAWDNKISNDWTDSALMKVLNTGAYYNRTSGKCPANANGTYKDCNFNNNGLTGEAKEMIGKVKWKLGGFSGGWGTGIADGSGNGVYFYNIERGTEVYQGHPTEWIGEVGLIYTSDYGLATSGGTTDTRESCLMIRIVDWLNRYPECKENNWLKNLARETITPSSINGKEIITISGGQLYKQAPSGAVQVFPLVYLKPTSKIISGTGTSGDPFILSN